MVAYGGHVKINYTNYSRQNFFQTHKTEKKYFHEINRDFVMDVIS